MASDVFFYFKKEVLTKMLSAFNCCAELPISLIAPDGEVMFSFMGRTTFCETYQTLLSRQSECPKMKNAISSKTLGARKSFLFACACGLHCLVIPIMHTSRLIFSILVGPFLFEAPALYFAADLAKGSPLSPRDVIKLHDSVRTVGIIPESRISSIETLLTYLFRLPDGDAQINLLNDEKTWITSQNYSDNFSYPYEKEALLISRIKSGNIQKANAVLNELLGYVLFTENGALDTAKSRAIELCCVLSRVTIENGATTNGVLNFNNECIRSIQTITDIYELGEKLQEITKVFISSIQHQQQKSGNELIQRAADYIATHYDRPLALEDLADFVHLNPSYFSSLFKQTTGTSFKSYLNIIRTENSKELLSADELSLMQIAMTVGFQDYNYFSKVFKKHVGLTPSQYRSQTPRHQKSLGPQ